MFEVLTENKAEGQCKTDAMGLRYRLYEPDKCAGVSTSGQLYG
jgi:hypothetical protein